VGRIGLLLITTGSNRILPLVTHLLNPLTKRSNVSCLFGKTRLPLNKLTKMSISFLFCVIYLLVIADGGITLPNPSISCINSKTCLSIVACVITNAKSPLLFTIKEPSPDFFFLLQCLVVDLGKRKKKSK